MDKCIKKLTPKEAWDTFIGNSVELFISFFYAEKEPIYDIEKMIQKITDDTCEEFGRPYTIETRNLIANLLRSHITEYIKQAGGLDKLKLYTIEEVNKIEDAQTKKLEETIEIVYGIPFKFGEKSKE